MKLLYKILVALATILIGGFVYFILNFGPIISGFGAKSVCSCAFVGNGDVQNAIDNELGAFPLSLGSFKVNIEDSSATGSVFGLAVAKAIYRKGLGCTLVRELSENEIKTVLPELDLNIPILSDTVYWPKGSKIADTIPSSVNYNALQEVVRKSFTDVHPKIKAKTRGVVVIYDGQLIMEQYAEGFDKNTAQLGWSMNKSVTSALYGIMAKKGLIDIYQPTPIEAWKNDNRREITTDALLRMSSGLHWEEVYSNVSTATNMLYRYSDMGTFASEQPKAHDVNSTWYYSSGTTNILALVMRNVLGDEDYYSFAQDHLFSKISVTTAVIEPDASGTFVGSSYMWASARDWARLGELYRNDGKWFGEQILPKGWVKYTTTPTTGTDKGQYGAQWWLNVGESNNSSNRLLPDVPTDMYMMDGYEGQRVFVVPSKKLVVVRLGQNKKGGFDHNEFLSGVINCIE